MVQEGEQGYSTEHFTIEYDQKGFVVRDNENHVIIDGSAFFREGFILFSKFQTVEVENGQEAKIVWDDIELDE
jgi:hypothetical protein